MTTMADYSTSVRAVSVGVVFRIERRTPQFSVQWISLVAIIPCDGARDETSEAALAEAFKKDDWKQVTRLYRNNEDVPDDRCWLRSPVALARRAGSGAGSRLKDSQAGAVISCLDRTHGDGSGK